MIKKSKGNWKCGISGCNAMWNARNVRKDDILNTQMERWYRLHNASQAASNNARVENLDVDDDQENEGFTQL